ncbi:hypothetical protein [Neolewinella persica]|uniref:hypothetical protein n=1 Tax=Neolewinella persica TaxID=70998 RepID=UPI000377E484|nr:hypothetical protein [Neolewinella persica]
MSQQNPDFPDIRKINAELFSNLDSNDIKDFEYLKQVQQNCMEQVNPFTCYVTILLGKDPKITWRHNTANHFGLVDLQFEDLIGLVHPSWRFLYVNSAKVIYEVAYKYRNIFMQKGSTAVRQLPLRHRSGQYYWYHQVSVKVADDGDSLAAQINYYQQSTPYEAQLPTMPQMATSGEVNKVGMKELNRLTLEFLPDFLGQFLSDAQVKFMLQYRKVLFESGGKKQVQGGLLKRLDEVDTLDNLKKLKQRIRLNVTDYFQHPSLDSAYGLGLWLNYCFPLESD